MAHATVRATCSGEGLPGGGVEASVAVGASVTGWPRHRMYFRVPQEGYFKIEADRANPTWHGVTIEPRR